MRFLTLVKSAENCGPVPPAFMEAMAQGEAAAKSSGLVVETGGLASSARSSRVRLSGGKVVVTDGPFTELKEVVGGYAVVEAASREEAVEGAVWLMNLHRDYWPGWEGEVEVRQILGMEDFAPGEGCGHVQS